MIYLDNAATTFPKPMAVYKKTFSDVQKFGANPGRSGHDLSIKTSEIMYKARERVKDFFDAKRTENVAFVLNCTMALNMGIKGILRKGDHVVISDLEHNAVSRPIAKLKNKSMIDYTVAHVVEGNDDLTLENFKKAIRPKTKLVICTHASNVFGIKTPIKRIGKMCSQEGIIFMVDAAQTCGICKINMRENNINILCLAPHKGLYSLMGTGIIITDCSDLMTTIIEGGTGSASLSLTQPQIMPDMLESGTQNIPGIISINHGIDAVESIGVLKIAQHEMKLIQYLYNFLNNENKVILYTSFPKLETHAPVLSFNIDKMDSEETVMRLNKEGFALRGGIHCAPLAHISHNTDKVGTVRIAPSMFTTKDEIEKFCTTIKKIIKEL